MKNGWKLVNWFVFRLRCAFVVVGRRSTLTKDESGKRRGQRGRVAIAASGAARRRPRAGRSGGRPPRRRQAPQIDAFRPLGQTQSKMQFTFNKQRKDEKFTRRP